MTLELNLDVLISNPPITNKSPIGGYQHDRRTSAFHNIGSRFLKKTTAFGDAVKNLSTINRAQF